MSRITPAFQLTKASEAAVRRAVHTDARLPARTRQNQLEAANFSILPTATQSAHLMVATFCAYGLEIDLNALRSEVGSALRATRRPASPCRRPIDDNSILLLHRRVADVHRRQPHSHH